MKFIKGQDRTQTHLFPVSLDQSIGSDNEVRLIDLFVDSLVINEYGFKTDFIENGRPAYHPADLLKLYIYGYLNRIRSSRHLSVHSLLPVTAVNSGLKTARRIILTKRK